MLKFIKNQENKNTILFEDINENDFFIDIKGRLALKWSKSYAWVFFDECGVERNRIDSVHFNDNDEIRAICKKDPKINLTITNQPIAYKSFQDDDIFFYQGHFYVKRTQSSATVFCLKTFSDEELIKSGNYCRFQPCDEIYPVEITIVVPEGC